MTTIKYITAGLALQSLLLASAVHGQQDDEPTVLGDDISFDEDFGFDDDIFASGFDEESTAKMAWRKLRSHLLSKDGTASL